MCICVCFVCMCLFIIKCGGNTFKLYLLHCLEVFIYIISRMLKHTAESARSPELWSFFFFLQYLIF